MERFYTVQSQPSTWHCLPPFLVFVSGGDIDMHFVYSRGGGGAGATRIGCVS